MILNKYILIQKKKITITLNNKKVFRITEIFFTEELESYIIEKFSGDNLVNVQG